MPVPSPGRFASKPKPRKVVWPLRSAKHPGHPLLVRDDLYAHGAVVGPMGGVHGVGQQSSPHTQCGGIPFAPATAVVAVMKGTPNEPADCGP